MSRQFSKLNHSSGRGSRRRRERIPGGGIKALGDGVQASGGSEGDSGSNYAVGGVGESVTTEVVGISLSVSRPLAVVVSEVSVAKVSVGVAEVSLGGGVKALGDGVQARWVSRGDRQQRILQGSRDQPQHQRTSCHSSGQREELPGSQGRVPG